MSGGGDGVFIEDEESDVVEYRDTRTTLDEVFGEKNEPDQSFFLNPAVVSQHGRAIAGAAQVDWCAVEYVAHVRFSALRGAAGSAR